MEEFYSLQGEGYHTGSAAWFIRIGGCDVGCSWCDVKESWNATFFPPKDTDLLVSRALECPAKAVILTGGEPLQYNLDYLCRQLRTKDLKTFLETSGSKPLSGSWDWICLSPKPEWPPREEFYTLANELKMIIFNKEDLNWAETQSEKVRPEAKLFLQPEWSQRETILPVIISYIQTHHKWKLSIQAHKYIGIP